MQVIFSIPSLSKSVCAEFFQSALATQHVIYSKGIDQVWRMQGGDPYLAKVRNRLASEFLTNFPDATDLFFLDDDMGWHSDAILRVLNRPEDVVVGVYPKKKDETEFPVQMLFDDGGNFIERDGLYRVYLAPTGFMRIKRHVLEKFAAESGVYADPDAEGKDVQCWDIFRMGYIPNPDDAMKGMWWGEDYFFSARCYQAGIEIWADPGRPGEIFTHRGGKVWGANFLDSIKMTQRRKLALVETAGAA